MIFARHILLLLLPTCFAMLLWHWTKPDPETQARADAFIGAIFSGDEAGLNESLETMKEYLDAALNDPEQNRFKYLAWLDRMATIFIVGGFCVLALLVPPNSSARAKANLLTTLVIGFCAAKLLVGFNYMQWSEFFVPAIIGFAGAFAIVLARGSLGRQSGEPDI